MAGCWHTCHCLLALLVVAWGLLYERQNAAWAGGEGAWMDSKKSGLVTLSHQQENYSFARSERVKQRNIYEYV